MSAIAQPGIDALFVHPEKHVWILCQLDMRSRRLAGVAVLAEAFADRVSLANHPMHAWVVCRNPSAARGKRERNGCGLVTLRPCHLFSLLTVVRYRFVQLAVGDKAGELLHDLPVMHSHRHYLHLTSLKAF